MKLLHWKICWADEMNPMWGKDPNYKRPYSVEVEDYRAFVEVMLQVLQKGPEDIQIWEIEIDISFFDWLKNILFTLGVLSETYQAYQEKNYKLLCDWRMHHGTEK